VIEIIRGKLSGRALALLPNEAEAQRAARDLNKKYIGN